EVCIDNEVWRARIPNITTATFRKVVRGDQAEVAERFDDGVHRATIARCGKRLVGGRVVRFEAAHQEGPVDMLVGLARLRVEGDLASDVGVEVGSWTGIADHATPRSGVDLEYRKCSRQNHRTAHVLFRVLDGHTGGDGLVRVINESNLRGARPYEPHLVVRIHVLR